VTPTFDLESEPEQFKDFGHLTPEMIHAATIPFTGDIEQVPPIHSAIKKDGVPAYVMARKGKEIKMEPRKVTISEFSITSIELPKVHFKVVCTTGTYIRSLANDFGAALHCGGHLSSLCRTRIGEFLLTDAVSVPEFEASISKLKEDK
jgi:tRNA pseudouridine55 synthase